MTWSEERCAFSQRLGFVRLLEGGGRGRSENEKRQSIEIDLSFRSKKERRRKVEMARRECPWRGYAHHLGYMTQGVIIHTHMASESSRAA